ncbi:MAG TPA: preprotein translocase subunit SecY [Chitinophagaceae bacterium]|nr:preprotein translocase subunit SecY [Chitinophagaceae bacterium]
MKKFIQTLKNIWSIEELRGKIFFTLVMIIIYRLGSFIVLPGIDPIVMEQKAGETSGSSGILDLINTFAGGAFNQASIFALGIMPYISASIFMQLMTVLVPRFQKMQKEGDSGRKKITQYTRYLTVVVTLLQASAYVRYLENMARSTPGMIEPAYGAIFFISTIIVLTAGTLFVMWMGEKITDKGLGNGTSLIIMVGILARLPQSFLQELTAKSTRTGSILIFIIEIAILIAIILGCILLIQGVRKVPVNYAKQIVGNRQFGGARQFLPLKVNSSGVMPIIFAQAIMFLPTLITLGGEQTLSRIFTDPKDLIHMMIYAVVVIGFTFLYTALIFNPKQIADNLKQNNGFIPGVKPGQPTADYIGQIMDRITLPGAILLAFVGILPGIAERLGVTQGFSTFFGGTSLLIMVGVVLDTLQQIETQLLMRQYDGLMKSGRIQGRQTQSAVQI